MKSLRDIFIEKNGKIPQTGDPHPDHIMARFVESVLEYTDALEIRIDDLENRVAYLTARANM